MTHEERIISCKACEHKRVDYERGIVCELKDEVPSFEGICPNFSAFKTSSTAYSSSINFKQTAELKPNNKRAANVIYALYANLIVALVALVSLLNENYVLKEYLSGTDIAEDRFDLTDLLSITAGLLSAATFIITAVLFIQWFRRAYYNLHLKVNHCKYPENQAAWAWFIPIINLFRPNEIMREMLQSTSEILDTEKKYVDQTKTIIIFWWIAWVLNNISSQIVWRIYKVPETPELIIESNNADLSILPFEVIAAILAIVVVKRYSKLEDQLLLRDNAKGELDQIGLNTLD